ncbi:ClpP/crotonase-like domain-containing protein [Aspergillus aurantiobrunneus]
MASNYSHKHFNITFPQEYVAHVEINRPNQLNAFFEAMWIELGQIFTQLSTDPSVRSIVITGAGEKAFTAGLDVKAASQGFLSGNPSVSDPARKAVHLRREIASFQDCVSTLEKCEKPVIVAMHGFSLGLAIDLSSAADVRVCARDTRFAVKEVDIGLAADVGTLSRLPKIVGNYGWVKDVCLTARLFGAEEALRVGFVSQVFDTKEGAVRGAIGLAALMASKSPVAVQGTKELLNWSRDHTVQDGLRYTTIWNSAALQTSDVSSALLSGIQKRKPTFEKL